MASADLSDHEGLLEVIKYALEEAIETCSVPDAAKYKATMTYMPAVTATIQEVFQAVVKSSDAHLIMNLVKVALASLEGEQREVELSLQDAADRGKAEQMFLMVVTEVVEDFLYRKYNPEIVQPLEKMLESAGESGEFMFPEYVNKWSARLHRQFTKVAADADRYKDRQFRLQQQIWAWCITPEARDLNKELAEAAKLPDEGVVHLQQVAIEQFIMRQLPGRAGGVVEIPAYQPLSQAVRQQVAYVVGWAIYKVAMAFQHHYIGAKNHGKQRLLTALDMLQIRDREQLGAIMGGDSTEVQQYKEDVKKIQAKDRGGQTKFSGLRYPTPQLLEVFFRVEHLCKTHLMVETIRSSSMEELSAAIDTNADVQQCWTDCLSTAGVYEDNLEELNDGQVEMKRALDYILDHLASRYMHVWLGEFKRRFEALQKVKGSDPMRQRLKNLLDTASSKGVAAAAAKWAKAKAADSCQVAVPAVPPSLVSDDQAARPIMEDAFILDGLQEPAADLEQGSSGLEEPSTSLGVMELPLQQPADPAAQYMYRFTPEQMAELMRPQAPVAMPQASAPPSSAATLPVVACTSGVGPSSCTRPLAKSPSFKSKGKATPMETPALPPTSGHPQPMEVEAYALPVAVNSAGGGSCSVESNAIGDVAAVVATTCGAVDVADNSRPRRARAVAAVAAMSAKVLEEMNDCSHEFARHQKSKQEKLAAKLASPAFKERATPDAKGAGNKARRAGGQGGTVRRSERLFA